MSNKLSTLKLFILLSGIVLLFSGCPSDSIVNDDPGSGVRQTYTVTFDSQDATVAASPSSLVVSGVSALSSLPTEPKKTGVEFGGWFTKPNGEGIQYSTTQVINSNITLYAYWIDHRAFTPIKDITDTIISYEISAKDPATFSGDLVIPSEYLGKPVTIAIGGFKDTPGITSVTFPNTLDTIADEAFSNSGLTGSLVIPSNIKTIGAKAFFKCENLDGSLELNEGLETIGTSAFEWCRFLTGELIIPSTITTLGSEAFYNCDGFNKLTIRDGVRVISSQAFYECDGFIDGLVIPDSVEEIGYAAFSYWRSYTGPITMSRNVKTIGDRAFSISQGITGELILPEGLESIGSMAFRGLGELTKVSVPSTVTTIGSAAFSFLGKGPNQYGNYSTTLSVPEVIFNFTDPAVIQATDLFEWSYVIEVKVPAGSELAFSNRGLVTHNTILSFVAQ